MRNEEYILKVKKDFISLSNYPDIDIIYDTPISLDNSGSIGDLNAALGFNIYSKKRDFIILYKENFEAPDLLVKSLFHEMIHLIDYHEYVKKYNNNIYDGEQFSYNNFFYFSVWSEFHAQYKSWELYFALFRAMQYDQNYILEFYNFEMNLIRNLNKVSDEKSIMKSIIRFIARHYFLYLYGYRMEIFLDIEKVIESYPRQKIDELFSIFYNMKNFSDYVICETSFIRSIESWKNIGDIVKNVSNKLIF